jgi:hypothetical protein
MPCQAIETDLLCYRNHLGQLTLSPPLQMENFRVADSFQCVKKARFFARLTLGSASYWDYHSVPREHRISHSDYVIVPKKCQYHLIFMESRAVLLDGALHQANVRSKCTQY